MRKKIGLLIVFLFVGFAACSAIEFSREEREKTYQELELFGDTLHIVQSQYVESKDPEELIYGALQGLLSSLDPYSQFLKPDDYKELLVDTKGQFGGLGIEISIKDGLLTVISPLDDTPAWREGIKAGDRIVKIEDELTRGITLLEAVKKLRGKPGTEINITILREKTGKLLEMTITREIIKIKDIRKSEIVRDNVGYIRLTEFRENTAKELGKALTKLKAKGAKAYILDLRNNPGGLLNTAVDVAACFIEPGKLVVYTMDRDNNKDEYKAPGLGVHFTQAPLVILVNKGSASASEIVAGCIKAHKRGILLGETTFGKALVQTVLPLPDGSAVRLTTAKYYTPDGALIQDKGIDPDISVEEQIVEGVDVTKEEEVFDSLKQKEGVQEPKKEEFYENDYQMLRALDLIKGLLILSSN